jgi:hypothetical protein
MLLLIWQEETFCFSTSTNGIMNYQHKKEGGSKGKGKSHESCAWIGLTANQSRQEDKVDWVVKAVLKTK